MAPLRLWAASLALFAVVAAVRREQTDTLDAADSEAAEAEGGPSWVAPRIVPSLSGSGAHRQAGCAPFASRAATWVNSAAVIA
jgi:hypothetical protein